MDGVGSFFQDVFAGFVANAAWAGTAFGIAFLGALFIALRQKGRMYAFFGIDLARPNVHILGSRLQVRPGGSEGTSGPLTVGYVGPALMRLEYQGCLLLRDAMSVRLFNRLPRLMRFVLKSQSLWLQDVHVTIDVAPTEAETNAAVFDSEDAIVLLGSDVYSAAARAIFTDSRSFFALCPDWSHDDQPPRLYLADDEYEPTFAVRATLEHISGRSEGRELAIIQRVSFEPMGKQYLMCAGISSSSTKAAAEYLALGWRDLATRFGDDDFGVCFELPGQEPDSPDIRPMTELPEYAQRRRRDD